MDSFSSRDFRNALGCFATGITVMTACDADGRMVGITVNSFASVSLDPPLISFCLDRNALSLNSFLNAPHFGVNVLAEDQEALSAAFARSSAADKFIGLRFEVGTTGCPLLPDCLSHLECEREAAHAAGDHLIVIGRVVRLAQRAEGKPLLYFRGRYAKLGEPPV
ncbi:MAG: flavin reductase family protein [Proteobacteria bacterium]|nr:flavin reductase family protein [Pseudomonadota bacterium]